MSENASIVKASLVLKNANSDDWLSINPILLKGEIGVENDTKLMKVGDGVTNYNNLEYINMPENQVEQLILANIPVSSNNQIGGVLSSNDDNYIHVDEEGKMSINKISISKIYNDDDDSDFIISGGSLDD